MRATRRSPASASRFPTRRSHAPRWHCGAADDEHLGSREHRRRPHERRRYALCRRVDRQDRKSTRLNSSHVEISYAVFCLKKKKKKEKTQKYIRKQNEYQGI